MAGIADRNAARSSAEQWCGLTQAQKDPQHSSALCSPVSPAAPASYTPPGQSDPSRLLPWPAVCTGPPSPARELSR